MSYLRLLGEEDPVDLVKELHLEEPFFQGGMCRTLDPL